MIKHWLISVYFYVRDINDSSNFYLKILHLAVNKWKNNDFSVPKLLSLDSCGTQVLYGECNTEKNVLTWS